MKVKPAFTLSEVMLVLSVIGVIAALTIPGLIQSTQNKQLVTQLKKEYSVLSQAFTSIAADNDGDITAVFTGTASEDKSNAMNTFASKLNVLKNCGTTVGCFYDTERKYLNGNIAETKFDTTLAANYARATLADGSMILINIYSANCGDDKGEGPLDKKVCGAFNIDVNGAKGPNTEGRDYFSFWITQTGIIPLGNNSDTFSCDKTKSTHAENLGCTAKVIQEGAMNY